MREKALESLACPRCGNTRIEPCGLYRQCVGSGGCGYVGLPEEFNPRKEVSQGRLP